MTNREKASRSRRQILDATRRLLSRAEQLVAERAPLLRGAFQLRGTRCGKENCKCAHGQQHTTAVLVVTEDGNRRSYYLRASERAEVKRRVERYQSFRTKRAEIHKLNAEVLGAADDLLEALVEPHQPKRDRQDRKQPGERQKSRRKA